MGFGILIDATCPLVDKVHRQIRKYAENNMNIVVIGKTEHPEIIGTVGQLSDTSKVRIIKSVLEAADLPFNSDEPLGFVTQTTLSVDETQEIVSALHKKYPLLSGLKKTTSVMRPPIVRLRFGRWQPAAGLWLSLDLKILPTPGS